MNYRRGLFRLWLVFTVLIWIGAPLTWFCEGSDGCFKDPADVDLFGLFSIMFLPLSVFVVGWALTLITQWISKGFRGGES